MNAAGFSVCGMDQQGTGRSGGMRFYCGKYVDGGGGNGVVLGRTADLWIIQRQQPDCGEVMHR